MSGRKITARKLFELNNLSGDLVSEYRKSQISRQILSTTSILYLIPSLQLSITSSLEYRKTGNLDYCYYNFLCVKPLGMLFVWNHILSNIGYMIMGLLFLCIVHRRKLAK